MELVRRLGATQGRISEHMACLVWCGFVQARMQGRKTVYRVANPRVRTLIAKAKQFLSQNEAQIMTCRRLDAGRDSV